MKFLEAPQRPLTREQLLRCTRPYEDIYDRSVDVQILRLRRKLQDGPHSPDDPGGTRCWLLVRTIGSLVLTTAPLLRSATHRGLHGPTSVTS